MKRLFLGLALLAFVAGGTAFACLSSGATAQDMAEPETQFLSFDVAGNLTQFVADPSMAGENGSPLRGATFLLVGYIYPAGTLTQSNGVLADGSPEFPDQVLGEWTCRGWFSADAVTTTTGQVVLTTQIYGFGGELGASTFVSDGYELADFNVPFARAVTGGTGPLANVGGQVIQTQLGLNATQAPNFHFEAELTNVDAGTDISSLLVPIPMVDTPDAATPTG